MVIMMYSIIFEWTTFTFWTLVIFITAILLWGWETFEERYRLNTVVIVSFVLMIGLLGFDQYRLNRAHNFSIQSSELSETELTYRENMLNEEKSMLNRIEKVDEMIGYYN